MNKILLYIFLSILPAAASAQSGIDFFASSSAVTGSILARDTAYLGGRVNFTKSSDQSEPWAYFQQNTSQTGNLRIETLFGGQIVLGDETGKNRIFGNLGIGTANPSEALDVVGNGIFSSSVSAARYYGDGSNLTGVLKTETDPLSLPKTGGTMTGGIIISVGENTGFITLNGAGGYNAGTSIASTVSDGGSLTISGHSDRSANIFLSSTKPAAFMGNNVGIGTRAATVPLEVIGEVKATSFTGSGTNLTGVVKTETDPLSLAKTGGTLTGQFTVNGASVTVIHPSIGGTNLENIAIHGEATSNYPGNTGYGLKGVSHGSGYNFGVYGEVDVTASGNITSESVGVKGYVTKATGNAAQPAIGVKGLAYGSVSTSASPTGVYGAARITSGTGTPIGVYGGLAQFNANYGYAGYFDGDVKSTGTVIAVSYAGSGAALTGIVSSTLYSKTMAQLLTIIPAEGVIYYCNDCSPKKVVVSTGTGAGNFADVMGGTFQ